MTCQPLPRLFFYSFLMLATALTGCSHKSEQGTSAKPLVVTVSKPVEEVVTDYEYFTGQTDAVESVDVRARVTGYLVKIAFKPGDEVKKDDLLFVIDPRPYQADLDRAEGQVLLNEAKLKLAIADYKRALKVAETPGAISQQEVDKYAASQSEAEAAVKAAKANLETYKLNLEWTKVTSPIDGVISRNYLTVGNLINQDNTLLTSIVSEDPIYAYFNVDERTLLRVQKLLREGKIKAKDEEKVTVALGLSNEEGQYPHKGTVDFVNNRIDPSTSTIQVRGVFDNPKPSKGGPRFLTPGLFVRIRVPVGAPHEAVLVTDAAVGTDQGQKYVLVVNDKNEVQYRRVQVGALHDGLREITEGLKLDERVIVSGLQRVRKGATVEVKEVPMPRPQK